MADIVERLTWLSSRHAEHMNDGPRLTDFCHAGREAASVITALRAENTRLRELVQGLIDNDPDEPISDGGHTVLDLWRHDARAALAQEKKDG